MSVRGRPFRGRFGVRMGAGGGRPRPFRRRFGVRMGTGGGRGGPGRAFPALFLALVAAQVAYGGLRRTSAPPPPRAPWATRALVGLMLATSLAEAVGARGARRGALPVLAAGMLGFAVELAGVATGRPFGHYAYSARLGPRVGGVPLLAAAAWALMARPAWVVAGLLSPRRPARVGLAAGALTAWDVYLDPRMVREGYWSWPGGGRYEGVPATNFLGWYLTGLLVFAAWARLDPGDDPRRDGDGALALYAWTWLAEGFANLVLWRRPVAGRAGLAAMGAFAAPALAARAR